MYYLIEETRVSSPLEQGLDHLGMAVLTGKMEGGEASVIDAIHEAESVQEGFDDVSVPIPRSLVQGSVPKLR